MEHKYTLTDLKEMQDWSLERKIQVTQTRIMEFYQRFDGNVALSVSGGKDSTVLLDLARRVYPDIEAVYVNTGLDYPEVRQFAMAIPNVTVLKPDMRFADVIKEYGWCFPSKDVAEKVYYARKGSKWALEALNSRNVDGGYSKYKETHYAKWKYLIDVPFKISGKCCDVMKEKPFNRYCKETNKKLILGTLAAESSRRTEAWLRTGCNILDGRKPVSKPLSFWTTQDVLEYIRLTKLPIASVYGDIVEDGKGKLKTTGEDRTGCIFCPAGCHLEKGGNRFQRLARTHPKLHKYCMNELGLGEFLDYFGIVKE